MSLDSSLKSAGGLARHRNVLTRAERIEKLIEGDKFDSQSDDPLGLPKVAHRKVNTGGKVKKKQEVEEGEATEQTGEAPPSDS